MSDPIHEQGTLAAGDAGDALRLWERHAGFLRRLARGLVADVGAADDVLQDAWLAAAQGDRPEGGRSQRAWLSGVVRNVARKLARSNARRHGREHRAARAESLPSASETAARVELLGQVVDAVHDLAEPYRTVLLLRFLDELAPKEIAERQGVPVDTVHTQVRRGLERLRTKLSSSVGCDEGTWLAALLPFATLPRWTPGAVASGTAATTGSTLAPALLMSTPAKLALTVTILAVATLTTWQLSQPDLSPVTAASNPGLAEASPIAPRPEGSPETTKPASLVPEARLESRVAAAPKETGWVLRGHTVRAKDPFPDLKLLQSGQPVPDDDPLPGVELVLRVWEGASLDAIDTGRTPDRERRLSTDETGSFSQTFAGITQCAVATAEPTGVFEGDMAFSWGAGTTQAEAGEQPAPVRVRLIPLDATILGRVTDLDGDPIADARVRGSWKPVVTDKYGRYRLPARQQDDLYLHAEADGYAELRSIINHVESGTEITVNLELKDEFSVKGTVVDEQGRPISGAVVSSFYSTNNEVSTDSLGEFDLRHLDPGRPQHMVYVSKDGYVLAQTTIPTLAGGVGRADFTLERGVRVQGHVVNEAGEAVEGAIIYIGFSPYALDRLDPEVLPGGSFVFPSVARGSATLVVQAEGYSPCRTTLVIPEDRDLLTGVEVVLEPGHFIGGRVEDEDGRPIGGVWVSPLYFGNYLEVRGETDGTGRFRIEGLPGSDLELRFYAPRMAYQRVKQKLTDLDTDALTVVLPPSGGIAGSVVDGITGRPIDSFRVRFVPPDELQIGETQLQGFNATWQREGALFESPEGEWKTRQEESLVPGGVIGIEIQADGYAPSIEPHAVVTLDPDAHPLMQQLFPGGGISGSVLDGCDHSPIEGAIVKLYRAEEAFAERNSDDTHGRRIAIVDASGRFHFQNIEPGAHQLLVLAPPHRTEVDGPFEVTPGTSVERTVELDAGATLYGTLRDWKGAARPNVELRLSYGGSQESRSMHPDWLTVSDEDGAYRFTGLPAGRFRIGPRVSADTTTVDEYRLALVIDGQEKREFDVAPAGTVTLVVSLGYEGELPGLLPVYVAPLSPSKETPPSEQTIWGLARDGILELHGLLPGDYRVRMAFTDYRSMTVWSTASPVEVTLMAGEQSEVYLEVLARPHRR